jgi:hypothetical protein
MPNPYHDPYSGQFCSRGEMTALMNAALEASDGDKYLTFREIMESTDRKKTDDIIRA